MAQVFTPTANIVARASIVITVTVLGVAALLGFTLYRSPLVTEVGIAKAQPIPFSHQRHVGANGLDCRYCHTSVEHSAFAGIPPTETCMTCHSQILTEAPLLQPVHESWNDDTPIEWARLHDLPDFTYFDHSIHVAKGIGCTTCHGPVDEMRLSWKAETFHMSWCLECHREPEKFVRPLDKVYDTDWDEDQGDFVQAVDGPRLVEQYDIKVAQLENCQVCHR